MGLMAHIPHRWRAWAALQSLRLRYWYLDTDAGKRAQVWAFAAALLVLAIQLVWLVVAALLPPQGGAPSQALWPAWVIQLIIAVVSAVISYALRPKIEPPKPAEPETPTTEDGRSVPEVHGTCWITEEFLLAWKIVGRDPIKTGGGKK